MRRALWLHFVKAGTAIVTHVLHNFTISFWQFHSQVQRGSIQCRRDPKDMEEWQFALDKEVAYKDTKSHHAVAFESSQKMEALEWMKARQHGSMNAGDGFQGDDALSDVLPDKAKGKRKEQLALEDIAHDEEGEEEEGKTNDPSTKATALNKAVEDAEVLSDLGRSKSKEQAARRVQKMIKLIKGVQKKAGSASQKEVQSALSELEKKSQERKQAEPGKLQGQTLGCSLGIEKG